MKPGSRSYVAAGLTCLMLLLPAALQAQPRMGAATAISLKDGSQVWGELIAVKPDSLLVLSRSGTGQTVPFPDISTIRIIRRSKALEGLLIGFLAGAIGGAIWGGSEGDSDEWGAAAGAFFGGLVVGTSGGLAGAAAGWAAGTDSVINFGKMPEAGRVQFLAGLDRLARERGTYIRPAASQEPGESVRETARARFEGPRFNLTWMPGTAFRRDWYNGNGTVPFSFLDDLPPGESGPFDSTWYATENRMRTFSAGRWTFGYQLTRRFGAEVELHMTKRWTDHMGELEFVSTIDGVDYWGYFGSSEDVSTTSLLAGLTYRPIPLAPLQPHVVEFGVAAGPAWIRTSVGEDIYPSERPITIDRRTTWTARVRASYDFHFLPSVSMGVFGEYRWLDASSPSYAMTQSLAFYSTGGYPETALTRTTAVTFPAQTTRLGGFVCGLRFGVGF